MEPIGTQITEELRVVLNHVEELRAEIERLRTKLAIQYGSHPGGDLAKAARQTIAQLRSENAELKAALTMSEARAAREWERKS